MQGQHWSIWATLIEDLIPITLLFYKKNKAIKGDWKFISQQVRTTVGSQQLAQQTVLAVLFIFSYSACCASCVFSVFFQLLSFLLQAPLWMVPACFCMNGRNWSENMWQVFQTCSHKTTPCCHMKYTAKPLRFTFKIDPCMFSSMLTCYVKARLLQFLIRTSLIGVQAPTYHSESATWGILIRRS